MLAVYHFFFERALAIASLRFSLVIVLDNTFICGVSFSHLPIALGILFLFKFSHGKCVNKLKF